MGDYDYYEHGTRNAICDGCGFKFKLNRLKKQWNGFMVCSKCWEREPPSNRPDIRTERPRRVEGRPEQADTFLAASITTVADAGY